MGIHWFRLKLLWCLHPDMLYNRLNQCKSWFKKTVYFLTYRCPTRGKFISISDINIYFKNQHFLTILKKKHLARKVQSVVGNRYSHLINYGLWWKELSHKGGWIFTSSGGFDSNHDSEVIGWSRNMEEVSFLQWYAEFFLKSSPKPYDL